MEERRRVRSTRREPEPDVRSRELLREYDRHPRCASLAFAAGGMNMTHGAGEGAGGAAIGERRNMAVVKTLTYLMFAMFAMTTDSVGIIIPEVIRTFQRSEERRVGK